MSPVCHLCHWPLRSWEEWFETLCFQADQGPPTYGAHELTWAERGWLPLEKERTP